MENKRIEPAVDRASRSRDNEVMRSESLLTRREMLGLVGMAGVGTLTDRAFGAVPRPQQKRPRIACLVSFWGGPGSHADWIIDKLMDGYWWKGTDTPSRVEVASVYLHQL